MIGDKENFVEWIERQNIEYVRDLCGRLHCLPDSADSLSMEEIRMIIRSKLRIDE